MLSWTGKFHQAAAVFPVMLINFVVGCGCGWTGPMIPFLQKSMDYHFSSAQTSWIASYHYIGKIVGSLVAAFIIDIIGRKLMFVVGVLCSIIAWLIVYMEVGVIWLYFSRMAYGVLAGIIETTLPIYISENCSPGIRGIFCSLSYVCFFFGIATEYVLAAVFDYNSVALINIGATMTSLVATVFLQETPQYLLMKGDEKRAKDTFSWLQASNKQQAEQRFDEIKKYISERKTTLAKKQPLTQIFKNPINRAGIRIVIIVNMLAMLTGYTGVNNYITTTFQESFPPTPETMTIIYGVCLLVFSGVTSFGFDKVGRRRALLTASFICFCTHLLFALLRYLHDECSIKVKHYWWILLACNCIYGIMFSTVICPVYTIIKGELLSQDSKAVGASLGVICNACTSFLVAKAFLSFKDGYGYFSNFAMYAFFSVFLFVYVYYELPETRGKTLVTIQRELMQSNHEEQKNKTSVTNLELK